MAELTQKQKEFYEQTMEMTMEEIREIESEIERELAEVKERITQLNTHKEAVRQIYEGACLRLGIESELEDEAEEYEEEM